MSRTFAWAAVLLVFGCDQAPAPGVALAEAECAKQRGVWTIDKHSTLTYEYCRFANEQESCIASGGEWTVGRMDRMECIRKSKDGGRPCRDSKQCQFGCTIPPGTVVTDSTVGTCVPDNMTLGPRLFVKDGKVYATIGVRE